MHATFKAALAAAALTLSAHAVAEVVFYEGESFQGQSFTAQKQVRNLERAGFSDRASSAVVVSGQWEVCDGEQYGGRCRVLRPGKYPSLGAMGLNDRVASMRAVSPSARVDASRYAPAPVAASTSGLPVITFYEAENFQGRSFSTEKRLGNFNRAGFNDQAQSVVVVGERWEVCEDAQFRGRCVVLRPGRYPSLAAMGLNQRLSSVREVLRNASIDESRYAPAPLPVYDNRRRRNERVYEAKVTSVRAVVGTPEQRCWIEKEQVPQERNKVSIPGALIGAVIGGVLGHQVGSGSGNTAATVGGAVAGGAAGSQIGRLGIGGKPAETRDVQRCENVPGQAQPDHYDVTYEFRGQEHRMQTTTPPGPTVTVNQRGEPRV